MVEVLVLLARVTLVSLVEVVEVLVKVDVECGVAVVATGGVTAVVEPRPADGKGVVEVTVGVSDGANVVGVVLPPSPDPPTVPFPPDGGVLNFSSMIRQQLPKISTIRQSQNKFRYGVIRNKS